MCCRYYIQVSAWLRPITAAAQRSHLYTHNIERIPKPVTVDGEIFPDMMVPVVATGKSGKRAAFPMIWGYNIPGIEHVVANARVETAAAKPSFRDGWNAHRCIVPASWYYEWEHLPAPHGKTRPGSKYAIMTRDSEVTWMCGIYRLEDDFPHFVILTREAAEDISQIHDRMPLILPEAEARRWVDPNQNPHMLLSSAVTDLVCEKEERSLGERSPLDYVRPPIIYYDSPR